MHIKICCLALAFSACISPSAGIYLQEDRNPIRIVRGYHTPLHKELSSIVKNSDPLRADPRKVFNFYCSKGKQQRAIRTPIRAVLPRAPKGVAIDKAAELREKIYVAFRDLAKSFYAPAIYEKAPRTLNDDSKNFHFYGLREASGSEFVKSSKELRLSQDLPITYLHLDGSPTVYLAMASLPTFTTVDYSGSQPGMFQIRESKEQAPNYAGIDVVFPKRSFRDQDGKALYPLYPTLPFETEFFSMHFTMLIPAATQQQIFGNSSYFLKEDGSFDFTSAINNRERLWQDYIVAQTSLKESQSDDPQIIDFEVELNLSAFCAYGRLVSDLVTD